VLRPHKEETGVRWRDLKLGYKIFFPIGAVLMLLALSMIWTFDGLSTVVRDGQAVSGGTRLRGELLQREVDHLQWAQSVGQFVYNSSVRDLTVQLDPTQCGFGKWYYGAGLKEAEALPGRGSSRKRSCWAVRRRRERGS
jgi:methyl-accepting chemotaxis protein